MSEWKEVFLEDIVDVYNKKRKPLNSRQRQEMQGKYPYYGASGIFDYLNEYIFDGQYLLISEDGENLRSRQTPIAFIVNGKFWVNNHAHIIKGKGELMDEYLELYFKYLNIDPWITGAVQPKLNKENLLSIPIRIPADENERIEITKILSNLDKKITLLRQQNQDLEELAQTIFKRWFVEFEFPNENGEPYKSSGGKMVESELGEIPEGWNLSNLGELAENKAKTYKFNGNDVVFINTGDVLEGKFLHKNYSNPTGLPGQAKKAIELNDILYSEIRPRNKRFAFVDFESSEYVVSTKFMVIKTKGEIYPHILYLILKQQASVDKIDFIAESRSGTFPQVTFDSISDSELLKAPMSIQQKFMDVLLPIMKKQKNNEQEIQSLTNLRDTLLPKLMSGELRVNL